MRLKNNRILSKKIRLKNTLKKRTLKYYKKHKKTKNKKNQSNKYYLKGGFESQRVINVPYNENLLETITTSLAPIFELIPTFSKDLIYVSFGSKVNETTLEEEYVDDNYRISRVNAGYQMVPFFLCSNSNPREKLLCDGKPCKVLNIVIDIFNDEEQIEASKRYIIESLTNKRELDASLDTSNITQIFVNIVEVRDGIIQAAIAKGKNPYIAEEHYTSLGMIADILCKKMKEYTIPDKNFMLCNYIKFKHLNPAERKLEKDVSITLSKVLDDNEYNNSYYEWLGYKRMCFYNCIILGAYYSILDVLFQFRKLTMFDGYDKNQLRIFEISKSDFKKGQEKALDVFKYIIPIKNAAYDMEPPNGYPSNNFCYSLYDLMN